MRSGRTRCSFRSRTSGRNEALPSGSNCRVASGRAAGEAGVRHGDRTDKQTAVFSNARVGKRIRMPSHDASKSRRSTSDGRQGRIATAQKRAQWTRFRLLPSGLRPTKKLFSVIFLPTLRENGEIMTLFGRAGGAVSLAGSAGFGFN